MLRRLALPVLVAVVAGAPLAGCHQDAGPPVAEFDMKDLSSPAMFEELARGLRKPYVLELPPRSVDARHSLALKGVAEEDVLVELVRLDPTFQFERRPGVLLFYPAGKEAEASPFSRRLATFTAKGGAADIVYQLVTSGALSSDTVIESPKAGARRPVNLELKDGTVRDVLAAVAEQAHVALRVEPGQVHLIEMPE